MPDLPQRFKLTLAYDGRPFSGWQSQPDANAVQDHVESALRTVAGRSERPGDRIVLHGSGRTDAGVHALGQVAHFDAPGGSRLTATGWKRALNANLPPETRVLGAELANADFHARFGAIGKIYQYRICHADVLPPHEFGRAWHIHGAIDDHALALAQRQFEGVHDFRAFAANRGDPSDDASAVRSITHASASRNGDIITLTFHGNGFLYRMVRLLTGSAIRVAQGREPHGWIDCLLSNPRKTKSQFCAPAHGLYLAEVRYPMA